MFFSYAWWPESIKLIYTVTNHPCGFPIVPQPNRPRGVQTLTFGRFWTHSYEHVSLPSILQSLTLRHLVSAAVSAGWLKLVHKEWKTLQTETKMALFPFLLLGKMSELLAKYELFWKDATTPKNAWVGGVAFHFQFNRFVFVAPA